MDASRQLRLGAFMRPVSIHTGAWRYPGAFPDANFNFAHYKRFAQTLERGRFDALFMADHLAVLNMPMEALKRSATATSFEPMTLLPALAAVTEHLGLIATSSTTYDEPFHVARRFASLDHISGGRAGWNLVTTSNPDAARNFGHDEHMPHGERYARAREFFDVVTGLWDSWADDAFIRDVDSGVFFNPERLHVLNHKGAELSVRGPLNIARPVQGWPVIVQAGSSEAGRQIAAETAEAVFTSQPTLADGQRFYADVKGRMAKLGRPREHLKILPGVFVVVGDTLAEARRKRALLERHRIAVDRARPRRLGLRSGRPVARDPGNQREPERARADDRAGGAREPDRAPARPTRGRLCRAGDAGHAGDDRRSDGGMAGDRGVGRVQRDVPVSAGRAG